MISNNSLLSLNYKCSGTDGNSWEVVLKSSVNVILSSSFAMLSTSTLNMREDKPNTVNHTGERCISRVFVVIYHLIFAILVWRNSRNPTYIHSCIDMYM